jgi:hypothetical protein
MNKQWWKAQGVVLQCEGWVWGYQQLNIKKTDLSQYDTYSLGLEYIP